MAARAWIAVSLCLSACASPATSTVAPARPDARPPPASVASRAFLELSAQTAGFNHGRPHSIAITPDGDAVLFLRSGPRSPVADLYSVDVATGSERALLSARDLLQGAAETLSPEQQARRERKRMMGRGISAFELSRDGRRLLVPLSGRLFVVERATGKVTALPPGGAAPIDPKLSPDGDRVAVVRDGDLYVLDVASGSERRLTTRPGPAVVHATAEFVAQEEMRRFGGYWWSPDSRYIAYQRSDESMVETLALADPMHPERPPRPARYPRAGTANADVTLGIIAAAGGPTVWSDWDRRRYPYLARVMWPENGPLTIVVMNRPQTEAAVYAVDPRTGRTTELLVERDRDWIDLDVGMPRWLDDGSGFLWTTERNGGWQLELRDPGGELRRALTPVALGMQVSHRGPSVKHVDARAGFAYITASVNPTMSQLVRVPLDPGRGRPTPLTSAPGRHHAVFARNADVSVRTWATVTGEARVAVFRGQEQVAELRSVAEEPPFLPNLELTTASDGEREFHVAIVRPRNFDPAVEYPVIDEVYGGPLSVVVHATPRAYFVSQWLADNGYIVVLIDGRGTLHRGRDWQRAIKNDFATVPVRDHAAALQALAARYPEMDIDRVGIFGWSFGGYLSAAAPMLRPDIFKVGVAGAPVVDWRDYDTYYTERYLGTPQLNPESYDRSSLLSHIDKLARPLLIIHGTVDDNVYFLHSLKLSDALFRAGKRHDFLPLSGLTHMVPDPLIRVRLHQRIVGYFDRHLKPGRRPARERR